MTINQTAAFLELFAGWPQHHIQLVPKAKSDKGKLEGDYRTVDGPIAHEMVLRHFKGERSLGVSPLREDNTCVFGALDIDIYDMDPSLIEKTLRAANTRSAVFRSKSRGIHLYVFTTEPVPATLMVEYLKMVRKRLPKKVRENAKEIFPKQVNARDVKIPSAINLPAYGKTREPIFVITADIAVPYVDTYEHKQLFEQILGCRISPQEMRELLSARQVIRDTKSLGYRVPTDAVGRNDLMWRIACSMQARGWPDDELDSELRRVNGAYAAAGHDAYGYKGPLDERELSDILKRVKQQRKGTPSQVNYDEIARFNERFAQVDLNGRQEFINKSADKFTTMSLADLKMKTSTDRIVTKNGSIPFCEVWRCDIDRETYEGVTIEPTDYNGDKYNIFRGLIEPKAGDVEPFKKLLRHLCSNDDAAVKWITHWCADAVQRPTEVGPPSALALRGPQGHGKSTLRRFLSEIVNGHFYKINESSRFLDRFNSTMFGSIFVFAEEAIFAGNKQMAASLKGFIADEEWTYEEKYRAKFSAKNVHRLVALTNDEQAVHVDHDDRRWTVIDVPRVWDLRTVTGKRARDEFFSPIYDYLNSDGKYHVLEYLLSIEVDQDLIRDGLMTQAKAEDTEASDPLIAVLIDFAITGEIPWDESGEGLCANKALAECVREVDRFNRIANSSLTKRVLKLVGGERVSRARDLDKIENIRVGEDQIYIVPTPTWNTGTRGILFPPRQKFIEALIKIAPHHDYPQGEWQPWKPPSDHANMQPRAVRECERAGVDLDKTSF